MAGCGCPLGLGPAAREAHHFAALGFSATEAGEPQFMVGMVWDAIYLWIY